MKIEDADDRDHWNITVEVAKNLGSKKKSYNLWIISHSYVTLLIL